MDHILIQVRDEIVSRLKAGCPSVANRVYLMHEVPPEEIDATSSPLIVLQLGDDTDERMGIDGSATDPAILEDMNLSFFVHCVTKMDGDAEKSSYNVRAEVETTLLATAAGLSLGGKVANLVRVAAANNRDEALDQGVYNMVVQFEAKVRHLESQPTSFAY